MMGQVGLEVGLRKRGRARKLYGGGGLAKQNLAGIRKSGARGSGGGLTPGGNEG